jgi:endo-1,4-beta-xylanase
VALDLSNSWGSGYVAQAKVTANSAITSWKVTVNLPSGATATSAWSATQSGSSGAVSFSNANYNGGLAAGASTTFGFQGNGSPTGATATCS